MPYLRVLIGLLACCMFPASMIAADAAADEPERPNIVWIVGEDASANLGCYGETTIRTPHLDAMAADGVKFTHAFVTCPVCSPSRSAMVTGMYQTTLGAHNHRSQNPSNKAGGNKAYYDSYRLPDGVQMVPELFQQAGYFTALGAGPDCKKFGKTDYNFIYDRSVYDAANWRDCPENKPFFAQIMLRGGKNRGAKKHGTDPDDVELPPYYPDHPVLRHDWADYLNSWVQMDEEVGQILAELEAAGVAENTIVFFWTDHGVSHLRGKQFLYDEGIHVPLIVRFGDGRRAGRVRDDLIVHIDVAATSLGLAGIAIPDFMQGRDLFTDDYQPRDMIFSARDRCDETVDIIRCVRTPRFKYIRNFVSHYPHAQPNQYKDGKEIVQTMRQLHAEGQLDELQDRVFQPTRPPEELYDLQNDPYETVNLAGRDAHAEMQSALRSALYEWMADSNDLGLIPEPILEHLGRQYGSKYAVLRQSENEGLLRELIEVIDAGAAGRVSRLRAGLESPRPSVRYWAATWLGNLDANGTVEWLTPYADDPSPTVRVAVALALCRHGELQTHLDTLAELIEHENLLVGMYAIRALERFGKPASDVLEAIHAARQSPYDGTQRYACRLSANLAD